MFDPRSKKHWSSSHNNMITTNKLQLMIFIVKPSFCLISAALHCLVYAHLSLNEVDVLLHARHVVVDVLPQVGQLVLAGVLQLNVQLDVEQLLQQLEVFFALGAPFLLFLVLFLGGSTTARFFAPLNEAGQVEKPLERRREGGLFSQKLGLKSVSIKFCLQHTNKQINTW